MKINRLRPFVILAFILGSFQLHSADYIPTAKAKTELAKKLLKVKRIKKTVISLK